MKTTKLIKNEGAAIMLSKEEVKDLAIKAGFIVTEPETGGEDKYTHLRKNTKSFLSDIKAKFGTSIISRKDPVLKDLIFKNRISSLNVILVGLEEKGIMKVVKSEGKIESIQLA